MIFSLSKIKRRAALIISLVLMVTCAVPAECEEIDAEKPAGYDAEEINDEAVLTDASFDGDTADSEGPFEAYTDSEEAGIDGYATIPVMGEVLPINSENFPDDRFRAYMTGVLKQYSDAIENVTGHPVMVSVNGAWFYAKAAIPQVTRLSPDHLGMSSAKGLEYFTSLKELSVSHNNLTELDLTPFKDLEAFACTFNAITLLDFRGKTALDPFNNKKFNISLQKGTLLIVCDPGSRMEEYCKLYLIPYCYTIMKERPKMTVSTDKQVVMVGEKCDLSAVISSLAKGSAVNSYSVSPKSCAYISSKGIIKGKKPGDVTVTAYSGKGSSRTEVLKYELKIEKAEFSVKRVNSVSLGEIIAAQNYIKGTEYRPDAYLSSKKSVAEIDPSSGMITVKGKGKTRITAMYGSGKNAAKISFTLKVDIPSLNKTKVYLKVGKSTKLKLKGTKEKPVFTSSDTGRVTVGSSGEVTGVAAGTATVTATVKGVGYDCTVIVVN